MRPLWKTTMLSLSRIVVNLCAMTRAEPCRARRSSPSWTTPSLCESSALVASSSSITSGFLTMALAMAIRCVWPPDRFALPVATSVISPSGFS
mmetsp:Transcript_120092/g.256272  ORF Transcript_120092/g.256272 Transcript_120092/m.256272 type:complete len:93 (-) Transcript_120092:529-807(-)